MIMIMIMIMIIIMIMIMIMIMIIIIIIIIIIKKKNNGNNLTEIYEFQTSTIPVDVLQIGPVLLHRPSDKLRIETNITLEIKCTIIIHTSCKNTHALMFTPRLQTTY